MKQRKWSFCWRSEDALSVNLTKRSGESAAQFVCTWHKNMRSIIYMEEGGIHTAVSREFSAKRIGVRLTADGRTV